MGLPRCARRGFRCAPRLRRAPQSGDAHSKRATGATCPFGTNGVPIRAVASRPLWIPRRESPCDPALRAGTLSGAAFGGKNHERVPPRAGFGFPPCGRTAFFAPLRGAPNVPPSAAEIAGSRPGRRADFLRAQEVGGRRALKGGSLEEDGGAKLAPLENPPTAHVQPTAYRRLMQSHPSFLSIGSACNLNCAYSWCTCGE